MQRVSSWKRLALLTLGVAAAVAFAGCDWPMFGYGAAHPGSSPDPAIDSANVSTLHPLFTGSGQFGSPVESNGVIYAGGTAGKLYAFDANGKTDCSGSPNQCSPLWTGSTGAIFAAAAPAVANGVVYISSYTTGELYAFDASGITNCSGTPKVCQPLWTTTPSGGSKNSPTVVNGVVYVGSSGQLQAYDAKGITNCSGTPKVCQPLWTSSSKVTPIFSSPAVANGVVYTTGTDDRLYAFSANGTTNCSGTPTTCNPLWTATMGTTESLAAPAVSGSVVYAESNDNRLYAYSANGTTGCSGTPTTCNPLWTAALQHGNGQLVYTSPAVANGVVYAGSASLAAFDANGVTNCSGTPKTCTPLWSYNVTLGGASPSLANGLLFIGSVGGGQTTGFMAFDASGKTDCTGSPTVCSPLWKGVATGVLTGSAAVANGKVYVVDNSLGLGRTTHLYAWVLPPPTTSIGIPSNNATVSGTQVLQAVASPGVDQVKFEVTGGTLNNSVVGTGSATLYGWLAKWDTTTVPNGVYTLQSVASYGGEVSGTSPPITITVANSVVTLPDMQIKVPTNDISIGNVNGQRQLQFTHITWDAGTGPFEIDPTYNSATGTSTFSQAIYNSSSPGVWTYDHSVPLAVTGVWNPPFDYQFPLTRFTLNNVNSDGSLGSVVATSPKIDYCITADTYVGGVANTPNSSFIPQNNCTNPSLPLGWSVGWGDQYDQTDSGQPISLSGIADGTYMLHAVVDPDHVLTESDVANDVTDTLLQITGNTVTVISQSTPASTPPVVAVTSPANGTNVSGTVTVQASAAATAPATITSVQFLLDGQPVGSPRTAAPYSYVWAVGSTDLGGHTLSARATDSNGDVVTAPVVPITATSSSRGGPAVPPVVTIANPTSNEVVSGTGPVAATVNDNVAVTSVQFFLDGKPLGHPATAAPYAVSWDTTTVTGGTHTISAQATNSSGQVGTAAPVTVTAQNPAPPMTCFVEQAEQSVHGHGTVTTPAFHTAAAGEVLVAFVSADGPAGSGVQTARVSGAGLTWSLVKRANAGSGDAEVWTATAPTVLSSATVTSREAKSGYDQSLTVIAMEGVGQVGASAAASGRSGAPSARLTTTESTSLVFAVGHDSDNALARTLPNNWVSLDQWVDARVADTAWTQYTNSPTGAAGSIITATDVAPTTDSWNFVAVELTNDDS